MNIHPFLKNSSLLILGIFLCVGCTSCDNPSSDQNRIDLQFYAVVNPFTNIEVSGLIKSQVHENLFWIHGDSGDDAAIYPIYKNGEIISVEFENGIEFEGTNNEDWEDIASDRNGNLFLGDIGNNCHCRDDLMILQTPEPTLESSMAEEILKYPFIYPSELMGGSGQNIPDAEALIFRDSSLYLFTKEPDGKDTRLLRLKTPKPLQLNELQLIQTINFGDKVTGADISESGDKLAILTSSSVWLLSDYEGHEFFSGTIQKVFFEAEQVESVAFSGEESLLIAEETGELYEVKLSEFD